MNTRSIDTARTEAGLKQDSVTLFDIAVPASGVRATENRLRVVRTVDPVLVTGAEAISASCGWDRDTCYAAAWVMVLSRILGEEEIDLYTWEQDGSTSGQLAHSTHRIPDGITIKGWLDLFANDRKQTHKASRNKPLSSRIDHLWLSHGFTSSAHPSGEALILGVGFDSSVQLIAEFSEAFFEHAIIEALFDSMLLVL